MRFSKKWYVEQALFILFLGTALFVILFINEWITKGDFMCAVDSLGKVLLEGYGLSAICCLMKELSH